MPPSKKRAHRAHRPYLPAPLVPPPTQLPSRKRARKITTAYHALTRQLAAAQESQDASRITNVSRELSSRSNEYQRASKASTSFHSTSNWVLSRLRASGQMPSTDTFRLLEIGAINSQLIEAATVYSKLEVTAIDLHSTHPQIQQVDFLHMPSPPQPFHAIVCSMVLNCVPAPVQRGQMLQKMHALLHDNGIAFITVPKTCLNLSPYMDMPSFEQLLTAVGLPVQETKDTPKVKFYVCRKSDMNQRLQHRWRDVATIHVGRKYRNDFAVTLLPP